MFILAFYLYCSKFNSLAYDLIDSYQVLSFKDVSCQMYCITLFATECSKYASSINNYLMYNLQ